MSDGPPNLHTFPPTEALVDALHGAVAAAVTDALADVVSPELVRARIEGPIVDVLREHVRAVEERLLRVERLAAAGQLSAGVAHELRNPLAVMETSVFILQESVKADERARRHLKRISDQITLASHIVDDVLDAVRARPIERQAVDLAVVAREAAGRVPLAARVALVLDLTAGVALTEGDARRLGQIVVNLVSNAVQALTEAPSPGEGARTVTLRAEVDGTRAVLVVEDDGPGIAPDALPRLFDPLFSTRVQGTGLGLALSRRIAEEHGGTLTAALRDPRGARFTLSLPRKER